MNKFDSIALFVWFLLLFWWLIPLWHNREPRKRTPITVAIFALFGVAVISRTSGEGSSFWTYLFKTAIGRSVHVNGTTSFAVVRDIAVAGYVLWKVFRRSGSTAVREYWVSRMKDAAEALLVAWLCSFIYETYSVKKNIEDQASSVVASTPRVNYAHKPPPFGWDRTGTTATPVSPTTNRTKPVETHARLEIIDVLPMTMTNGQPYFNVFYTNHGAIPSQGFLRSYAVRATSKEFDPPTLLKIQTWNDRRASAKTIRDMDVDYHEIYPNESPHFFSVPGHVGEESELLAKYYKDVLYGNMRIYVFATMICRDAHLPPRVYGVTESCFFYWGSFSVRHDCGNRYVLKGFKELVEHDAKEEVP